LLQAEQQSAESTTAGPKRELESEPPSLKCLPICARDLLFRLSAPTIHPPNYAAATSAGYKIATQPAAFDTGSSSTVPCPAGNGNRGARARPARPGTSHAYPSTGRVARSKLSSPASAPSPTEHNLSIASPKMPSSNLPDYRHARTGSLNIPPHNGHTSPLMATPRFDGPRSPPSMSRLPRHGSSSLLCRRPIVRRGGTPPRPDFGRPALQNSWSPFFLASLFPLFAPRHKMGWKTPVH